MPGFLLHLGATVTCSHAGQVSAIPSGVRVRVGGQPAVTVADTFLVAACPFPPPPATPHPCVRIQWLVPATRVRVNGQPALLQDSVGLGLAADQVPQGPPIVVVTQVRVRGT
jgi:hypothetical protein